MAWSDLGGKRRKLRRKKRRLRGWKKESPEASNSRAALVPTKEFLRPVQCPRANMERRRRKRERESILECDYSEC